MCLSNVEKLYKIRQYLLKYTQHMNGKYFMTHDSGHSGSQHLSYEWVPYMRIRRGYEAQEQVIIPHSICRMTTVYPKKYAHGFRFAVLCCGYTLTDFPIFIRLTSLALWQSNDCPSASKATLMNMDKYFMWIHYERLHDHNKAKHNKTVCIFLGIYCSSLSRQVRAHHFMYSKSIIAAPKLQQSTLVSIKL